LAAKNPQAAKRAADAIKLQIALLETMPDIGRPFPDVEGLRELIVDFGDSGYVALYRHDSIAGVVYLLAFRHQKEAGL